MCNSTVAQRLNEIKSTLLPTVRLVAVSKFHPTQAIAEAYGAGQRLFGESRVQELLEKIPQLPADIEWHFIGHLQTNKVKQLIGKVALIESVDSLRLLQLIDDLSAHHGVVTRVLLQVHVAKEETKFGFLPEELVQLFKEGFFRSLKATHLCGLMGMASNTPDTRRIERDFSEIAQTRHEILAAAPDLVGFDTLSMGMSHDYELAIAHGATHVRIGSAIFGERNNRF